MGKTDTKMFVIPPSENGCPTTDELRRDAPQNAGTLPGDVEAAIIDVATQTPAAGETHLSCAVRREGELVEIFGQLTAVEALGLGQRLDRNRDDDPVATALRRFTPERVKRLRAFLVAARRRTFRRTTQQEEE